MDASEKKDYVKKIDLRDYIKSNLGGEYKESGEKLYCLCPFHNDQNIGSFVVTSTSHRCYVCDPKGGDIINFVQKTQGLGFMQALDFIIEKEAFKSFQKKELKKKEYIEKDIKIINDVYQFIIDNSPLTEDLYGYLEKDRKMSRKEANFHKLFNFNHANILNKVKGQFTLKDLVLVPGFYVIQKQLRLVGLSGLGIPIINPDGMISAIQVRDMNKNADVRYRTCSSSKAKVSSGTPIGYIEGAKKEQFFITEGFFKAERLNKFFCAPASYIQGINSWERDIEDIMSHIKEDGIKEVVIALDMDFITNDAVFKAMKNLNIAFTKQGFRTKYLVWKGRRKGFDDYYNEGMTNLPVFINPVIFDSLYQRFSESYEKGYIYKEKTFISKKLFFDETFDFVRASRF